MKQKRRRTSHECSLSSWKDAATQTRGGVSRTPPAHPYGSERTIKPSGGSPNALRTVNGKPSKLKSSFRDDAKMSPPEDLSQRSITMSHALRGCLKRYGMRRGSSHLQRGDEMLHAPEPAKAQDPSQHGLDRPGPGQVSPGRAERVYNLPSITIRAATLSDKNRIFRLKVSRVLRDRS